MSIKNSPDSPHNFSPGRRPTRIKVNNPRPPIEQNSVEKDLEIIHSQMEDAAFEKLWDEGSTLTTAEAIDLALKETTLSTSGGKSNLKI